MSQALELLCRLSPRPTPMALVCRDMAIAPVVVEKLIDDLVQMGVVVLQCAWNDDLRVDRDCWAHAQKLAQQHEAERG